MQRRVWSVLGGVLLCLGCGGPRFVPAGAPTLQTYPTDSLPSSCDSVLEREPMRLDLDERDPRRVAVRAVVSGHLPELQSCYVDTWGRSRLEGQVVVRFALERMGRVCALKIQERSLHNQVLEGCLLNAFASWQFPEQPADWTVVTYTLNFRLPRMPN